MIKQIDKAHINECAEVICCSFKTVADEFNITKENAPKYVAFATDSEKLKTQLNEGRLMYAYFNSNKIVGYYSLSLNEKECEINNLCVLSDYRHCHIGKKLLEHAFEKAKELNCKVIKISIVEENKQLKK